MVGLPDDKSRLCPQAEHACRTFEGEAVWQAVRQAGGWAGGGMTPRRIDRAAVRARLSDIEGWIVEDLIDSFEAAALNALAKVEDRRRKSDREARKGRGRRARRAPDPDPEEWPHD